MQWESDRPGQDLLAGGFVRVLPGAGLIVSAGSQPLAKIEEEHGSGFWTIDLGADHDDFFCVQGIHLRRILVDLHVPSLLAGYLRSKA